jgi:hypothetical protein
MDHVELQRIETIAFSNSMWLNRHPVWSDSEGQAEWLRFFRASAVVPDVSWPAFL